MKLRQRLSPKSGCPIVSSFIAKGGLPRESATAFFSPADIPSQDNSQPDAPAVPAPRPIRPILPEGEAILQPPMDNTPNDTPDHTIPSRIPNLGHAMLFLAITGLLLILTQLLALAVTHTTTAQADASPKLLLASEAFTYVATLVISWFFFPILWQRPFAIGIQFNHPAAIRNAARLVPLGLLLSVIVQAVSSLITLPKTIPMDDFFRTPSDVWIITFFGTLLAPLYEEVLFRGFLLPAFAIAYDWLSLPRTPAAREQWNSTNQLTTASFAFSAVLTSILFAALHGKQVAFAWPVLALLFSVSLILTTIRIRLRSVAASALVHASYNLAIFIATFIATGGYRHFDHTTR